MYFSGNTNMAAGCSDHTEVPTWKARYDKVTSHSCGFGVKSSDGSAHQDNGAM